MSIWKNNYYEYPRDITDPKFRNEFGATITMHSSEMTQLIASFVANNEDDYKGEVEVAISKLLVPDRYNNIISVFMHWDAISKATETCASAKTLVVWSRDNKFINLYVELTLKNIYHKVDILKEKQNGQAATHALFDINIINIDSNSFPQSLNIIEYIKRVDIG